MHVKGLFWSASGTGSDASGVRMTVQGKYAQFKEGVLLNLLEFKVTKCINIDIIDIIYYYYYYYYYNCHYYDISSQKSRDTWMYFSIQMGCYALVPW